MAKRFNNLKEAELKDADRRSSPRAVVVYEAIRLEGRDELSRSAAGLLWSGLAAGLSMGFSFVAEALLRHNLDTVPRSLLISKLGYSVGFLIVVLGRQQLFTENTLTPVLQLLHHKDLKTLLQVARLWLLVLGANIVGTMMFALLIGNANTFDPQIRSELNEIGKLLFEKSFTASLLSAVFAGWLIALMVWLLPFAETGRVSIIFILTYLVGLAGFGHIIAGSVETFYMLFFCSASWTKAMTGFFIPVLLGNIIGGVSFVAVINHAQVVSDFSEEN